MAKIIAVCNQKGGVGKSTTAVNVAAYLALADKRVLLIDLDSQGNATTAAGIQRAQLAHSVYECITGAAAPQDVVQSTAIKNFYLLPSTMDLAGAEIYLAERTQREYVVKQFIKDLSLQYDAIIIDCPPSLGLVTLNALVAAQSTLIPMQCEYLALEGLNALVQTVSMIQQQLNPSLKLGGIVFTMADFRANLTQEVVDEVKQYFKDYVYKAAIPRSVRIAEAPSFGKPICLYEPYSAGALAYHLLTQEIIEREHIGADHVKEIGTGTSGSHSDTAAATPSAISGEHRYH